MSTPAWIPQIFAGVALLVAEVSAGQLVMARAWTRGGRAGADIAVSRLLTGIAVAGVLVPVLSALPDAAWEAAFAVMAAWFAWRLRRESRGRGATAVTSGHYAPHLVHSAAMLYVFAALTVPSAGSSGSSFSGSGGMSGMAWASSGGPALQAPTLAVLFALLLVAFAVRDLDRRPGPDGYFQVTDRRLVPSGSAPAAARPRSVVPAVAKGCQVATSVTMAFMLIILI